MPGDDVFVALIEKIDAPELIMAIGIIVVLAYVVVKSLPMVKELRIRKIDCDSEIERMRLEIEQSREKRKAEEAQAEAERDRARTEVIGKQNEIQASLARTIDGQTIQMAGLIAQLEESKERSRSMKNTVDKAADQIDEIHTVLVKMK